MRDERDRALDRNPEYPPGFDLRELEDAIGEDGWEDEECSPNDQIPGIQIPAKPQ